VTAQRRRALVFGGRTLAVVAVTLTTLALLEGALRIASRFRSAPFASTDYKSKPWHTFDNPLFEVWHIPNASTVHSKECLEATYTSNSLGMRDKERTIAGSKPRIALLGDSVVEGFGVSDEETFSRVLEDHVFGGELEFLNFGTSGEFGTIQEWLLYRHLARQFKPDLVLLVFLHVNDLTDNSWQFWQKLDPSRNRPYFRRNENGALELFYPQGEGVFSPKTRASGAWHNALFHYCYIWRYWVEVSSRYTRAPFEGDGIYRTDPPPMWEDAWQSTEEALRRLRDEVKEDGGTLVILDCPSPVQIIPGAARALASRPGYDIELPGRRLQEITTRLGLTRFSLLPAFLRYRDLHHLEPPYFSFTCDPHLSPMGNRVMADAIAEILRDSGLDAALRAKRARP
jgi:hypothetical protein